MSNLEKPITADDRLSRGFVAFLGGGIVAEMVSGVTRSVAAEISAGVGMALVIYNGLRIGSRRLESWMEDTHQQG